MIVIFILLIISNKWYKSIAFASLVPLGMQKECFYIHDFKSWLTINFQCVLQPHCIIRRRIIINERHSLQRFPDIYNMVSIPWRVIKLSVKLISISHTPSIHNGTYKLKPNVCKSLIASRIKSKHSEHLRKTYFSLSARAFPIY